VRYGLAIGIKDWPESIDDPEWSVAAGLAMYSAKLKAQAERHRSDTGWLGKILR
jgi:cell division protein FtsA